MSETIQLQSDEEMKAIIMAFVHGNGSITEDEAALALTWANEARLGATMLDFVLGGRVYLCLHDGEIAFTSKKFGAD